MEDYRFLVEVIASVKAESEETAKVELTSALFKLLGDKPNIKGWGIVKVLEHQLAWPENKCPVCGGDSIRNCKCSRKDSECENAHTWHTCTVHRVIVPGHSDHSIFDGVCTCSKIKKRSWCPTCGGYKESTFIKDVSITCDNCKSVLWDFSMLVSPKG